MPTYVLNQTDTGGATAAAYCSGLTAAATVSTRVLGGTVGTGTTAWGANNAGTRRAGHFNTPAGTPNRAGWAAGTATIRVNVTTGNTNVTIDAVYLCRTDQDLVSLGTWGSATGLGIVATAGVKTISVPCAAIPGAVASDRLVVVVGIFKNTGGGTQSITITNDQSWNLPDAVPLGTQYMVHNRRDTSGQGHIVIRSRSGLGQAWSAGADIINFNDSGLDVGTDTVRFGQLLQVDGAWYLFFSSEETGPPMKCYRAKSTYADPADVPGWGSITKILDPSGVADAFDEDGAAQPFVVRIAADKYRMVYAGYDASLLGGLGAWAVGMAFTTTIEGTWTKYSGNPVIGRSTLQTQFNGANNTGNPYTVDSTTGFAAGQLVVCGPQTASRTRFNPSKVRKVLSGTSLELFNRIPVADNEFVTAFDAYSIVPRCLRRAPDFNGWEIWATVFRTADGEEYVGRYVSTLDLGDPMKEIYTLSTDRGSPWIGMMYRTSDTTDFESEENPGFVFDARELLGASQPSRGPEAPLVPLLVR